MIIYTISYIIGISSLKFPLKFQMKKKKSHPSVIPNMFPYISGLFHLLRKVLAHRKFWVRQNQNPQLPKK